jgi:hypothetical protein
MTKEVSRYDAVLAVKDMVISAGSRGDHALQWERDPGGVGPVIVYFVSLPTYNHITRKGSS